MKSSFRFLALLALMGMKSCQGLQSTAFPTDTPVSEVSPSFFMLAEPSSVVPTQALAKTPTNTSTTTPTFDQSWAVNYPTSFTTAGFTIKIVRVEATLKQYFHFKNNWEFRDLYHNSLSIILIFARVSNDTDIRTYWDETRCVINFSGEPYDDTEFKEWGIGNVLTWDVPPHGSILGGLSFAFGSRTPKDLHIIDFDCPRPIQKSEPHFTDIGEPVKLHMAFDNPQWVDPPEELMGLYNIFADK